MEQDNSIFGLIKNSINSLKPIIDVDSCVGKPVVMQNGDLIFPVVEISVGYVAGGGEYQNKKTKNKNFPFAGGATSGCLAKPVGFLVVSKNGQKMITIQNENSFSSIMEKLSSSVSYFVKKSGKAKLEKIKMEAENAKK